MVFWKVSKKDYDEMHRLERKLFYAKMEAARQRAIKKRDARYGRYARYAKRKPKRKLGWGSIPDGRGFGIPRGI